MAEIVFDIRGRQEGKTTRAVQWLREAKPNEKRILISISQRESRRLWEEHGDLERWQFADLGELRAGFHKGMAGRISYALDNLDLMLPYLLEVGPHTIDWVTATGTAPEAAEA